jgi:hypothetical protein
MLARWRREEKRGAAAGGATGGEDAGGWGAWVADQLSAIWVRERAAPSSGTGFFFMGRLTGS